MSFQTPLQTSLKSALESGIGAIDWLTSAAEMLAALRLLSDAPEKPLERDTELTTAEWAKVRGHAEQIWRESCSAEELGSSLASPFAQTLDAKRWPPGYFENLRLAVRELASEADRSELPYNWLVPVTMLLDAAGDAREPAWLPLDVALLTATLAGGWKGGVGTTVYCAFEGAGFPALFFGAGGVGTKVLLEIPDEQTASLWAALAVASSVDVRVIVAAPFDRLSFERLSRLEYISKDHPLAAVVVPPAGLMSSEVTLPDNSSSRLSSEAKGVLLASVMGLGRGVCVVLNSFLYRSSITDQEFKRTLISQGLETVISLPAGTAGMGSNLAASIVILDRFKAETDLEPGKPERGVFMVDATKIGRIHPGISENSLTFQLVALVKTRENGKLSRLVSIDELAKNDFNLLPTRYVRSDEAEHLADLLSRMDTVRLSDLVEIYRPQPSPKAGRNKLGSPEIIHGSHKELVVSDLSFIGTASSPSKSLEVSQVELQRLRRAELQPGDIVLVTKGSVGRVGLIHHIPEGETWVANQSFAILRLRRASPIRSSTVLFRYLNSKMGQELLQNLKVGSALPTLQMADLKRLPVIVPDDATQEQVIEHMADLFRVQAKIDELRLQQADMQAQIWPETIL
jgi:type I restriction enzyme M protein